MTESRGMRWVRHVACIGKKRMQGFCEDTGRKSYHMEDLGTQGRITLGNWMGKHGLDSHDSGLRQAEGS